MFNIFLHRRFITVSHYLPSKIFINMNLFLYDVRFRFLYRYLDVFNNFHGYRMRNCDLDMIRLRYRNLNLLRDWDGDRMRNWYRIFFVNRYLHWLRCFMIGTTSMLLLVRSPHCGHHCGKHLQI